MWAVDNSDPAWPVAHIYRLDNDAQANEPEILNAYSSADIVLVCGSMDVTVQVSRAIAIAKVKKENQLAIAVMTTTLESDMVTGTLAALRQAFDAVFVVEPPEKENIVRRLAKALITPGSAFQPACCDWNDLRTIVSGHTLVGRDSRVRLPRYGFGRATGEDGAQMAMHAALSKMECKHTPIGDERDILCLIRGPKDLRGSQIKQSAAVLHAKIAPNCWVAKGIEFDETLPQDTFEVDLFAFGGTGQ